MANDYYTRQGSYTKGTLARGDVVRSDYDALVTAFDLAQTNIKRAIKLPNEGSPQTDFAITDNAANRATKAIGFDSLGALELQTGVGNWEGTWATATDYELRDVVVDGAAGANTDNLYICIVANTSGTWSTDLAASKWSLMVDVEEARNWARKQMVLLTHLTIVLRLGLLAVLALRRQHPVGHLKSGLSELD